MKKTCTTCDHNQRDCDPIRCIEGGILTAWKPILIHDSPHDAARYADSIGHTTNYEVSSRPDGRYDLKLGATP